MKKFLAMLVAAMLVIALFAVPAQAESNIIDVDDSSVTAGNLDDFLWTYYAGNGPLSAAASAVTDIRGWMNGFVSNGGLGFSSKALDTSFDKIMLRGWIGFDQEITMFGYQINDEEPVFDPFNGTFSETTEDPVKEAGGQYARRYRVVIPLTKAGQFSMRVVAKLADGTIVRLNSATRNGLNTEFMANNLDTVNFKSTNNVINYDESSQYGMSLDRIDWNFTPLLTEGMDSRSYTDTFLDEDGKLDAVKYGGAAISYAGWVDFLQPVIGFGYMINDKIVLEPGMTCFSEDTLISTLNSWEGWDGTNAQRFYINVPIGNLTGENYVCAVAQLQDGTVVKLNSTEIHNRDTSFTLKCLPAPEETQEEQPTGGLRDFDQAGKGDKMSYDQILVNGAEIANGNDAVIAAKALVDGSDGSIQTVAMHGWYGNSGAKIESFGYMIDNNDPVFGDFRVEAEQAVIDAGGEARYTIVVDVSGLKDGKTHKIQAVVKLDNGDIVKLNRNADGKDRDAYVNYKAFLEESQPTTGDATVMLFAVVLVLALGAAVVFAKKRAF